MERLNKQTNTIFPSLTSSFGGRRGEGGFTLVELIVSMGIFAIVMTMFTGFFITLFRLQTNYRETANLNQESRIVSETFSRFAREAETVTIDDTCTHPCDHTITFKFPRGVGSTEYIDMRFRYYLSADVDSGKYRFEMGYKQPDNSYNVNALTSTNVVLTDFNVSRGSTTVYPKVLEYNFTLAKKVNGIASADPGDTVSFKGFVNMRSEE